MSYTPTVFVDDSAPGISAAELNKLGNGLQAAAAVADSASTIAAAALPTPAGSNGQFLKRVGGVWVPATFALSDIPDPGAGKVVTSAGAGAVAAYPPGYQFTHAEFTTPVTLSATSEATATSIVSASSITGDGGDLILEFWCPYVLLNTAASWNIEFFDGSTALGGLLSVSLATIVSFSLKKRLSAISGAKTYSVRGWVNANSSSVGAGTGAATTNLPGFLRITKAA